MVLPAYLIRYSLTGENTKRSHMSMLYSFLITNGYINDLIIKAKCFSKPYVRYEGEETLKTFLVKNRFEKIENGRRSK